MSSALEVLLVEDNLLDAELTLRALKSGRVANRIVHVKDGEEALNWLFCKGEYADRDASLKPKVVLLDLKLPKIDGIETLRAIRSDERTKCLPVVMLTSSKEEQDIIRSYELGVNSYIVKPVGFESFSKAVTEAGHYWLLVNEDVA
jgi:two-component system, response regulator